MNNPGPILAAVYLLLALAVVVWAVTLRPAKGSSGRCPRCMGLGWTPDDSPESIIACDCPHGRILAARFGNKEGAQDG